MSEATTDTEKMILDAAVKEFSLKGFDGARTQPQKSNSSNTFRNFALACLICDMQFIIGRFGYLRQCL